MFLFHSVLSFCDPTDPTNRLVRRGFKNTLICVSVLAAATASAVAVDARGRNFLLAFSSVRVGSAAAERVECFFFCLKREPTKMEKKFP